MLGGMRIEPPENCKSSPSPATQMREVGSPRFAMRTRGAHFTADWISRVMALLFVAGLQAMLGPSPCRATSAYGRIRVQILADHQDGLAVRFGAGSDEGNVGG